VELPRSTTGDVSDGRLTDPHEAIRLVTDAARRMLNAVEQAEIANEPVNPTRDDALGPLRVTGEIHKRSDWDAMTQYQAIAMSCAAIVWASRETGRSPESILDELANKFEFPD
jgi:hypothetical protein